MTLDKDWAIEILIDHGSCRCTHCQTAMRIMDEPDDLDHQQIHNQQRKLKAHQSFLAKTHDVREILGDI
jgi:hypothetical protein